MSLQFDGLLDCHWFKINVVHLVDCVENLIDFFSQKLETLSTRVERVSSLLRARIEVSMEKQSRDLLVSMDKRADLQMRLQETVEGLSIVVLSYYLLGIIGYGLKALKSAGLDLDIDVTTGIAIPFVVGVVYFMVNRLKRMARKE